MGRDEPLLLSCRAKAMILRQVDASVLPLSRNNRLSHTPVLHLPTAPAAASSSPLKPSSSPSSSPSPYSSSPVPPTEEEEEEGPEREAENLPPRRPLKLAPLELPLQVKEAQRLKMISVQQEVRTSGPRKVKACGSERARSPARPPLTTIINPSKLQQRDNRARLLEKQPAAAADNKEINHIPAAKSDHLSSTVQSAHTQQTTGQLAPAQQTTGQSAHAQQTTGQSGHTEEGGCRRRPRLRRTQRLEEDQSRSGSFTAGPAAEEEKKPGQAWTDPSQRSTENALREASRVLEKVYRRNAPAVPEEPPVEEKFSRRKAVYDIQEAAL
ncbi:zinc finger homeobox protein 3 [Astyanax mexicanus]|uniref:zinc finger homeobox protein 3 n=1 Tax=Astyanax mexicanus TaxID=7994 RepID=UPI0020CABD6C|nr:zinc finger homeobox protein 3 [Astyanax mexicanus]